MAQHAGRRRRRLGGSDPYFYPPVRGSSWSVIIVALLMAAALAPLGLFGYDAYGYDRFWHQVDAGGLKVQYGLLRLQFPVEEIDAVALVAEPPAMSRVQGVAMGGLRRGWFRLPGYGRVYRLTTTRDGPVVFVDTTAEAQAARPNTRYVFSPEQPEQFVAQLQAAMDGQAGGAAVFPPLSGSRPTSGGLLAIGIVSLVVIGATLFIICRGPRSLRYRVGPDGIGVYHLFGEHLFPWSAINKITALEEPIRAWRVVGASMPGYHVGSFQIRGTGSARVFATKLAPPIVMIDSTAGRIIISPADIKQFMAAAAEFRRS